MIAADYSPPEDALRHQVQVLDVPTQFVKYDQSWYLSTGRNSTTLKLCLEVVCSRLCRKKWSFGDFNTIACLNFQGRIFLFKNFFFVCWKVHVASVINKLVFVNEIYDIFTKIRFVETIKIILISSLKNLNFYSRVSAENFIIFAGWVQQWPFL